MIDTEHEQFLEELRDAGPAMLRLVAGLGAVAFAVMWFIDPFLAQGADLVMAHRVRVVTIALFFLFFAVSLFTDFTRRWLRTLSLAAFMVTGLSVIVLTHLTGGPASNYHEALYLTMFGYGMLPWPWRSYDAPLAYIGLVTAYVSVMVWGGKPAAASSLPTHGAILYVGIIVAVGMSSYMMQSRRSDFMARVQLARANEQLMALDQAKSRFFANLSHELRTPLTLTLAPLDALLESSREPISDGQREKLELAQRNALRLLRHVDDLLALTRAEAASLTLRVGTVDLRNLMELLAADIVELAKRKKIEMRLLLSDDLPTILADHRLIERVMLNVVGNAAKFVREGGKIDLAAAALGPGVQITVTDNGIGISPADLPHIFDRFYQADSGSTRSFGGTGIGLALAREIVELHGGTLSATSELGVGTVVTCWLPCELAPGVAQTTRVAPPTDDAQAGLPEWHDAIRSANAYRYQGIADATERRIAPRPRPKGQVPTVLIVEDNPDMIRFISALLGHDYAVRSATDGAAGLRYATDYRPDLIISDVMMPVMDGFEMGRRLRASPVTREIPLIYLTARGTLEDRVAGHEGGADSYLAKPFRNEELLAVVEGLLSRQRHLRDSAVHRQDEAVVFMASGIVEAIESTVEALRESRATLAAAHADAAGLDTAITPLMALSSTLREYTHAGLEALAEPTRVATVIDAVAADLGVVGGTQIVHTRGDEALTMRVQQLELRRIVETLLSRAVRVTPLGHPVGVACQRSDDGFVSLLVTDEGPRVPPADAERLFFPFQELSSSSAPDVRAGMAFSLVGRLVAARGGTVSVGAGASGGTLIVVRLPGGDSLA